MKIRLDVIEARLQALIEQWMIPIAITNFESRLAHQLVQAFQEHIATAGSSLDPAPQFAILVHSDLIDGLMQHPNLFIDIAAVIQDSAREIGLAMPAPPVIKLVGDDDFPRDTFQVRTDLPEDGAGQTAVLRVTNELLHKEAASKRAFFIIKGNQLAYLDRAVINIGRKPENHFVIEDPRVSREHAQVRYNRGKFILFDLNSTGGTVVNGQRIRQWTLFPGDVVVLAGFPMIYGEEETNEEDVDDTGKTISMQDPPG